MKRREFNRLSALSLLPTAGYKPKASISVQGNRVAIDKIKTYLEVRPEPSGEPALYIFAQYWRAGSALATIANGCYFGGALGGYAAAEKALFAAAGLQGMPVVEREDLAEPRGKAVFEARGCRGLGLICLLRVGDLRCSAYNMKNAESAIKHFRGYGFESSRLTQAVLKNFQHAGFDTWEWK